MEKAQDIVKGTNQFSLLKRKRVQFINILFKIRAGRKLTLKSSNGDIKKEIDFDLIGNLVNERCSSTKQTGALGQIKK